MEYPELFAGVEGRGAADAAFATALRMELCTLKGTDYVGGAVDVFKCFDQLLRPLIGKVLEAGGMPDRVRSTYCGFLEELTVRNTIAGGVGKRYDRKTGIPQGDPMSMMATAILLRPWVLQMRDEGVTARVLADDLQILSHGKNCAERFRRAYEQTHSHLMDMGARIQPSKCVVFSNDGAIRQWLRGYRWRQLGTVVDVVNDCRDLGARISVTQRKTGGYTNCAH